MVSVIQRVKKLRLRLAYLRVSPGAVTLPSTIKKISLEFARRNAGGHMGPRKFWRDYLPGIKFYNPDVELSVNRPELVGGKAEMTVETANGEKKTFNILNKTQQDIMAELTKAYSATPIPVSEEDKQLAQQYLQWKIDEERKEVEREARKAKRKADRAEGLL
ncbi:hypothetical protein BJ508DRAFT_410588 [Ascobolus immersus RN42]|uniref:Ribosomal protein/NADH dehydrogenase domain-containing protein n=1 Tax=Ascobolus immersus RN42 TaxID=1160509 RepID=A0A3N4ILJ9_ASCIM|nr:hypothetical protein BJ508DRAFT_410588 [Ascobolus immersus RN42]